ncbi:MAG: radical SAM protein [DPANN group archaeon]|nr:radical SAM protein [DPANN group archaeon]
MDNSYVVQDTRNGGYPYISHQFIVVKEPGGGIIYSKEFGRSIAEINDASFELLSHCTGNNILQDIITKYRCTEASTVIDECISKGVLSFSGFPALKSPVNIINKREYNPHTVHIELTKKCNLRCVYCYNASGEPLEDELSTKDFLRVLEILKKQGVLAVTFTGGEPFTKKDVMIILEEALKHFDVSIMTNGQLLGNDEWFNSLTEHEKSLLKKVIFYQISLDSLNKEKNDAYRGKGTYDNVERAVKRLRNMGPRITISATITQETLKDLPEMEQQLKKWGVKLTMGALEYRGRAKHNNMKNQIIPIDILNEFSSDEPNIHTEKYVYCNAIRGTFTIRSNGFIKPCTISSEVFKVFNKNLCESLHIFELEDKELPQTGFFKLLRTLYYFIPSKEECGNCENYSSYCKNCGLAPHYMKQQGLCKKLGGNINEVAQNRLVNH